LCRMVHKMLEKDPRRRYGSAPEILRDLRHLHQQFSEEDWPQDVPGWESMSVELPADRGGQVTQRLDRVMKTVTARQPARRWLWAAAWAAAFLLGGVIAWFAVAERYLLADADALPPSGPPKETALQQYLYASRIGTEDAWQSVIRHPDHKEYFDRRARQQLARIYLHNGDYDRAMEIFERFLALGPAESEFRAFGLAGKCGILSLQGKHAESAAVMEQFWPLRKKLTDRQMQLLLSYAVKRNRSKLGDRISTREWDRWLAEHFRNGD